MSRIRIKLKVAYTDVKGGGGNFPGEIIGIDRDIGEKLIARGAAERVPSIADSRTGAMQATTTKPAQTIQLKQRTGFERLAYYREQIKTRGEKPEGRSLAAMEAQLARIIGEGK